MRERNGRKSNKFPAICKRGRTIRQRQHTYNHKSSLSLILARRHCKISFRPSNCPAVLIKLEANIPTLSKLIWKVRECIICRQSGDEFLRGREWISSARRSHSNFIILNLSGSCAAFTFRRVIWPCMILVCTKCVLRFFIWWAHTPDALKQRVRQSFFAHAWTNYLHSTWQSNFMIKISLFFSLLQRKNLTPYTWKRQKEKPCVAKATTQKCCSIF